MAMNKRLVLAAVTDATDAIQDALAVNKRGLDTRPYLLTALGVLMSFEQELKEDLGV